MAIDHVVAEIVMTQPTTVILCDALWYEDGSLVDMNGSAEDLYTAIEQTYSLGSVVDSEVFVRVKSDPIIESEVHLEIMATVPYTYTKKIKSYIDQINLQASGVSLSRRMQNKSI